ncbi:hypothetical protein ACFQ0G_42655 [Streptomyces chiangmaiensis]
MARADLSRTGKATSAGSGVPSGRPAAEHPATGLALAAYRRRVVFLLLLSTGALALPPAAVGLIASGWPDLPIDRLAYVGGLLFIGALVTKYLRGRPGLQAGRNRTPAEQGRKRGFAPRAKDRPHSGKVCGVRCENQARTVPVENQDGTRTSKLCGTKPGWFQPGWC